MEQTDVLALGKPIKCPHCGDENSCPTHQGYTFCQVCKRLGYETKREEDGTIFIYLQTFVPAPKFTKFVLAPAPA